MASNIYVQHYADGTSQRVRRIIKQGRKPAGLSKPQLVRLYNVDKAELDARAAALGEYWNENEFIRQAVHKAIEETRNIYTELVNT